MFTRRERAVFAVREDHQVVDQRGDAVDLAHDQLRGVARLGVARRATPGSRRRRGCRRADSSPRARCRPRSARRRRARSRSRRAAGASSGRCGRAARARRRRACRSRRAAARRPRRRAARRRSAAPTRSSLQAAPRPLSSTVRASAGIAWRGPISLLERLAERRLARGPEDAAGLRVRELDAAGVVQHDDAVEHGVEHALRVALHGSGGLRRPAKNSRARSTIVSASPACSTRSRKAALPGRPFA